MGESRADFEAVTPTEGPGCTFVGLVVNDDRASAWADWCCVEVEWRIVVVFPGRHSWRDVRLTEKVDGELCLWQKLVP